MDLIYTRIDWTIVETIGLPLIAILVFLAGRELVSWCFKINKRIELLVKQNELLEQINDNTIEQVLFNLV